MIVHKFGGSSLGSGELFANVADIVIKQHSTPHDGRDAAKTSPSATAIVVVSAMSGTTDQLMAGARAAAEGKDAVYREVKARLLGRHLEVVQTALTHPRERLEVGGLTEQSVSFCVPEHQLQDTVRLLHRELGLEGEHE